MFLKKTCLYSCDICGEKFRRRHNRDSHAKLKHEFSDIIIDETNIKELSKDLDRLGYTVESSTESILQGDHLTNEFTEMIKSAKVFIYIMSAGLVKRLDEKLGNILIISSMKY